MRQEPQLVSALQFLEDQEIPETLRQIGTTSSEAHQRMWYDWMTTLRAAVELLRWVLELGPPINPVLGHLLGDSCNEPLRDKEKPNHDPTLPPERSP